MLAVFCLRLAFGMVVFLPLLPPKPMHPRFFRTQFLTALGLTVIACGSTWHDSDSTVRLMNTLCVTLALIGATIWTLDPPPLGIAITIFSAAAFAIAAVRCDTMTCSIAAAANGISSGLLMGGTVTAMLVGHSYLISPGLTLRPLLTMLAICLLALMVRIAIVGWGLWMWQTSDEMPSLMNYLIWLMPRWVIGIGGPALFGTMAFLSARIRSTQSATGILYVVVICAFLGELMGMVVAQSVHLPA